MDTLSVAQRSERMGRIRSKDTRPEMVVRRLAHRMGYRFRLHRHDLPGSPDLVFGGRKKAIFVHGCFWHGHQDANCKLARLPKSRLEFWQPKLERNRQRDLEVQQELEGMGWGVLTIWECQLGDLGLVEMNISEFIEG